MAKSTSPLPLYLALAYADDPKYAPHRQATEILSYDAAAAKTGYKVEITAEDGFTAPRVVGPGVAVEILDVFLKTEFEGGRHRKRLDLIDD